MRLTIRDLRFTIATRLSLLVLGLIGSLIPAMDSTHAETLLFQNAIVHTVSGEALTNGQVLVVNSKISGVNPASTRLKVPRDTTIIDLKGQHLYPGLIALDTALGLIEISGVRATIDAAEVGDFTPDVESWVAVNPDSELLPVTRANGIAYFEPIPRGNIVSGQSGLLTTTGWTYEQMIVKKPAALHLFWPNQELNFTTRERSPAPAKWKSLEDQAKERRARLRSLQDFFDEAAAYAKARDAAEKSGATAPDKVPAWDAMLPYVRGELPIVIHADELRQIKSAVNWAATNQFKIILAGGRDAWRVADLLATNKIPVIFESTFTQPVHDSDSYDVHFSEPALLYQAGVKVVFSMGPGGFTTPLTKNMPYLAAQAIAFGLPASEALKGVTLYPAQLMGVANRLGSIEVGKDATLFIADGDIFDLRANVKRLWISGSEVSLENRHTRLYEKYKNRPKGQ